MPNYIDAVKGKTAKEITKNIFDYIDRIDEMDTHPINPMKKLTSETRSWLQNGYSTGIIIGLLLELRESLGEKSP